MYPGIAVSCWSALHKKRYKKQDRSARPMRDTNVGGTAGSVVYFQLRPAPTVIPFSFVRRTWSSIPAIFYPSAVVPSWGAAGLPAAIWTRRPVSGHVYCCNSVNPNELKEQMETIAALGYWPICLLNGVSVLWPISNIPLTVACSSVLMSYMHI